MSAGDVTYAYRTPGRPGHIPLILLTHLGAVLDNWDPAVVDGLAADRQVIAFDNRGVGASTGKTPNTIEATARDAVSFIRALGHQQVDLLGLSLGGMVAQAIALREPRLIRKLILAGTGPAWSGHHQSDPPVEHGPAARCADSPGPEEIPVLHRGRERATRRRRIPRPAAGTYSGPGHPVSLNTYRAHLTAVRWWGEAGTDDLSLVRQPMLVANGDNDVMVPTVNSVNSVDLAERLPDSDLVLYPDAGHGGIFQHHADFVAVALAFLGR